MATTVNDPGGDTELAANRTCPPAIIKRAHSTPDPDAPPPDNEPVPDEVPQPEPSPVREPDPIPHQVPIRTAPARVQACGARLGAPR